MGIIPEQEHNHRGLSAHDFRKISENGFGDPYNAYPHSMLWMHDHLYVGTTRAPLAYRGRQRAEDHPDWLGVIWPVKIPEGIWDIDLRAEIWRYAPQTRIWNRVFSAPLVEGSRGDQVPLSVAFRSMASFQGRSDSAPAIYVPTMATYQTAAVMLRSTDGINFEPISKDGFGFPDPYESRGVRALVPFKNRLFTAPAIAPKGQRKSYNFPATMIVLVTDDPVHGKWRPACEPHFGDPGNMTAFQIAAFNGYLYAGTGNVQKGFQIWKTDAEGHPPYQWQKVIDHGAHRGKLNQGAITMKAFKGCLYVGTGIQEGGYDRYHNIGPAAVELIRIYPDDSWDLIVGDPRITPQGLKVPVSGLGPGFGKPSAGYLWSLCEHDGWLYAGTFDWLMSVKYGRLDKWPKYLRGMLTQQRMDQIISRFGGFDIWRSRDGNNWSPVTENGFGNPYNIGARTMVSTKHGLFVGAVNPFAPEVAIHRQAGWQYEVNPKGGLEIWLGDAGCGQFDTEPIPERIYINDTNFRRVYNPLPETDTEVLANTIERFYKGSRFRHFGFWTVGDTNPLTACENLMDELLAFVPEKKGRIADIGCGMGASTEHLLKHYPPSAVTGITSTKENRTICRSAIPMATFLYRKIPKLKLRPESYDCVIWVSGLERLGARKELIRESFRILRPGGRLVCFELLPVRDTIPWRFFSSATDIQTPEEYGDLLRTTGFEDIQLIDVTADSIGRFRKYTARYFAIRQLSGEIPEKIVQEAKALLLGKTGAWSQCFLVAACKVPADSSC
ncbi:MAG: class I SAM-dependent methyltransferase [Desulfobulbaceae bacterium]|nr:class I SAM-dependent methyltransferase [Desulfobulbaceae bacterium]